MTIRRLKTANDVIDAIGRPRVLEITGLTPNNITNWLAVGYFPAKTFCAFNDELKRLRCSAPRELWQQIEGQATTRAA